MTARKRVSLKPRKLPQQPRAAQTVATILEAAARILETRGVEGLNTNLAAQRAGVSIGSLYQYFPGKDAIIVALCQRERGAFLAQAQAALTEPDGRRALRHLITASVSQQLQRPTLARLLDAEKTRPAIARELAPFLAAMRALIGRILAYPDIPRQIDEATAIGDLMAIMRGMVNAAGEEGEADLPGLEARVGRAVFGYLGMAAAPRAAGRRAGK